MKILGIDIEFEMLVTESQAAKTQHDCLLYGRGATGHQVMAALFLQRYQPRLYYLVHGVDRRDVFPQTRSVPEQGTVTVASELLKGDNNSDRAYKV